MRASNVKLTSAAIIAIVALAGIQMVGFTVDAADERQGVMIDFAYYDVEWVEMDFPEGMTGMGALMEACSVRGYDISIDEDGRVYSVDNRPELLNVEWGMYILNDLGVWIQVNDPDTYMVHGENIVS